MQEGRSRPVLAGRPSPPAAVHPPPLLTFPLAQTVTTTPQKNCLDLVSNQAINNSNKLAACSMGKLVSFTMKATTAIPSWIINFAEDQTKIVFLEEKGPAEYLPRTK